MRLIEALGVALMVFLATTSTAFAAGGGADRVLSSTSSWSS